MATQQTLDSLADRTRRGIETSGIYTLDQDDLRLMWNHDSDLTEAEKRLHVENFARIYGFRVHINSDLSLATFRT